MALDVTMDRARLEDLMLMAVKAAKPPMVGALKMKTGFSCRLATQMSSIGWS